jgi:hypothetical protein
MGGMKCVCGCERRPAAMHHVVYVQELRWAAKRLRVVERVLTRDVRGQVPIAFHCHGQHHLGAERVELVRLPDEAFEFAAEVLGAGPGYEYLRRRYAGEDPRLDALLTMDEEAA